MKRISALAISTLLALSIPAAYADECVRPDVYGYDYIDCLSEGLARVEKGEYPNKKFGFIDKTGKVVIPLIYDYAWHFSEGLAGVEKNGKRGFVDKTGKVVIPLIYDDAGWFSEGLAEVGKNGKYGFVDKTGKVVVPLIYDYAYHFYNGEAEVSVDDEHFYIDKEGRFLRYAD